MLAIHPSAVVTVGVSAVAWWGGEALGRHGRRRLLGQLVPLVVAGVVAVLAAVPMLLAMSRVAADIGAFRPDIDPISLGDALDRTLRMTYDGGDPRQKLAAAQVAAGGLALVGAVVLAVTRRALGAVTAWLAWAVIVVATWVRPGEGIQGMLTNVFYDAQLRVWSHASLFVPTLAGVGVAVLAASAADVLAPRLANGAAVISRVRLLGQEHVPCVGTGEVGSRRARLTAGAVSLPGSAASGAEAGAPRQGDGLGQIEPGAVGEDCGLGRSVQVVQGRPATEAPSTMSSPVSQTPPSPSSPTTAGPARRRRGDGLGQIEGGGSAGDAEGGELGRGEGLGRFEPGAGGRRRRGVDRRRWVAVALSGVVALAYLVGPGYRYSRTDVEALASRYARPDYTRVSASDRRAVEWLAAQVAPGERVLNSANDGSTLLYVDRQVPIVNVASLGSAAEPAGYRLLQGFNRYPVDADVRRMLRELDVRWVYVDSSAPTISASGAPSAWAGDWLSVPDGLRRLGGLPGLERRFRSGTVSIYRLDPAAIAETPLP